MASTFRYRFVDIGTVFTGDSRTRDAGNGGNSPATLFSNELACDVGGTCWGLNEPLAIIDHPRPHEGRFPSASAAVLHKATRIRDRFVQPAEVIWLVTHGEPDFDAFCSMYLARWVISDPAAAIDWERYGLDADGWVDLPHRSKIDWFAPDLSDVAKEHRWALLLVAYASMLEMRRHISCARERSLHSVFYAALKRGRDYLSATSGATELFDEVKSVLKEKALNPAFDSVLEGNAQFAPELAMLDREADAYRQDLQRARKSVVYLPESEAPTPDFFEHRKKAALQPAGTSDVSTEHLRLADTFRIPTDGIYLRDPECVLFREWARVDLANSALGAGFEFSAIAYSGGRPGGPVNTSRYVFSIDPERANGRHLHTVWSRLETEEVQALRVYQGRPVTTSVSDRAGQVSEQRQGTLEVLLSDPWSGGQSKGSNVVDTPGRGTLIGPAGTRSDLRDDPVAEAIRTELENSIYAASSLIAGPQTTIYDFPASRGHGQPERRLLELSTPLVMPPPEPDHLRFATVGLRPDVPLAAGVPGPRLIQQIGETLWHVLYPERPGSIPPNFEGHLVVTADSIGVWGERGVAIAQKHGPPAHANSVRPRDELSDFEAMVSLVRDIDRLASEWNSRDAGSKSPDDVRRQSSAVIALQKIVTAGEGLAVRALELQRTLALPERELLRRFCDSIGFDQLVARLRDLNSVIAEHLRHYAAAEQARRTEKRAEDVARIQQKAKWFELFVVGFMALAIIGIVSRNVDLGSSQQTLVLFGGPGILGVMALLLQPWRRKLGAAPNPAQGFGWVLGAAILVWLVAWLAQVFRIW